MKSFGCVALLAAAVLVGLPGSVEGQIGGLGRLKKAAEKVRGQVPAAAAPAAQASGPLTLPEGMIALDAAGVDRLLAGMRAEVEDRGAVATEIEALTPRADYDQCAMQAVMTPAAEAAIEALNAAVERYLANPTDSTAIAGVRQAEEGLQAVQRERCGPSPDEADVLLETLDGRPVARGAAAAGMTDREYAMAKERAVPFCANRQVFQAGREGTIPGDGRVFWIWTAAEVDALLAGCEALLPLLEEVA